MRVASAAAAAFLLVASAHAQTIAVSARGSAHVDTATLTARRLDAEAQLQHRTIAVPSDEELALGAGTWEVRASAQDVWSAPAYVRNGERARIDLWPLAEIHGTSIGVKSLRVRFSALDEGAPSGDEACTIDGDAWRCAIPAAGRYDLTFASHGFAPEFRWNESITTSRDLGRIEFTKGASLSGRLEFARGVRAEVAGSDISLAAASGGAPRNAKANARGFFQFRGVPAGEYVVRAAKNGLTSRAETVRIIDGAAAELNAPLLLDRSKQLSVSLLPLLDPSGAPWRVALYAVNGSRVEPVTESASADGKWLQRALVAGEYRLEIRTSGGGVWDTRNVTIAGDDVALAIGVAPQHVSGIVKLGERPIAATLTFGGEGGVELRSGDDGRFAGSVPPPEQGDEWSIAIESSSPDIHRVVRTRDLSLVLPATTLLGRVRNEDGSAAQNAILAIRRVDDAIPIEQAFADSDGHFQLAGFAPGRYDITAEAFQRTSDVVHVDLQADVDPAQLEIVVRNDVAVRGRIVIGDTPIAGARIVAFPRDSRTTFLPEAMSNGDGRFELALPPNTGTYDLFAAHPAFDIISARLTPQREKLLLITTQQSGGMLVVDAPASELVRLEHDGAELPMRWAAENSGGSASVNDKRQHIEMRRLEAGHYAACVRDRCVAGFVPPFGTLTLSVAD